MVSIPLVNMFFFIFGKFFQSVFGNLLSYLANKELLSNVPSFGEIFMLIIRRFEMNLNIYLLDDD